MYFTACFDKLNNRRVFACEDCYNEKDILKSLGFHWNSNAKEWERYYNTPAELSRILMETMLRCDCSYEVFDKMYSCPLQLRRTRNPRRPLHLGS